MKRITTGLFVFGILIATGMGWIKARNGKLYEPPRNLAATNATEGLFPGMNQLFTIPNYWDYGNFVPQKCAELPGKLFRAKAGGTGCREVFLISGQEKFYPGDQRYELSHGALHAAWRVRVPDGAVSGGRYSYVHPGPQPWQVWLSRESTDGWKWNVQFVRGGKQFLETAISPPTAEGWYEIRLRMQPQTLELRVNSKAPVRVDHDPYPGKFEMHFGSAQPDPTGPEVVSEFRYVFFDRFPYPDSAKDSTPEGPEDIRPKDELIRQRVGLATPESPRHTEGDILELKDGSLLLVWSDYFMGKGWDGSPARLSAKISKDGGRTWGKPWTVVDYDPKGAGNVMSASLVLAGNGDILMAYYDRTPQMKAKGMVLRRSKKEGKSWSAARPITPNNGNRHVANNDCFRRLRSGRIVLSCREYTEARWPYALYSDDDGETWNAGKHVPAPDLTSAQVKAQNVNEPSIGQLKDGRLIMMMRTVAGGHFFSYSSDEGETWSKPEMSPLRGVCAPPYIVNIPSTGDLLAIWSYGLTSRTPLNSAISRDGGKTWNPVKLLEKSEYFGYGYTSVDFVGDRVCVTTMQYPLFVSMERFQVEPGYSDLLFLSLPLKWFYRSPDNK